MKSFLFSILLLVCTSLYGGQTTNGVVYFAQPTECHLIAQNGVIKTNQLVAGKTYMVINENAIAEFSSALPSSYYLSSGIVISTGTNASLSIDVFDQEINNLSAQPSKAAFGSFNVSVTLTTGEFVILCPSFPQGASFTVNTPFASYEISGGKYLFRVSDKSVVAYVGEGTMQVHGDKSVDKTEKGKIAVAIPFHDPTSGIDDKIVTSIKMAKTDESSRYTQPIDATVKSVQPIEFVVISGNVIGVLMK